MRAVSRLQTLSKIDAKSYNPVLEQSPEQQLLSFLSENDVTKYNNIRKAMLKDIYAALYSKRVLRLNEMYVHIAQLEKLQED